jgi:peptide/nickel transport system ATP-binding protein
LKDDILMSVRNLHISFNVPSGIVDAVRGISFDLGRERLGIVGESGSGKSQACRALLKLMAPNARVTADKMDFDGFDILNANKKAMRLIRGKRISMIMQDPLYSLNPLIKVGKQVAEGCRVHEKISAAEAKRRALDMLETVKIRDASKVYNMYPHQISGGMGQRIMIAMMLILNPEVLIADEPTSALDVTVQLQILALIDDMVSQRGMGLILISHDLSLVSTFCDRILVMYGGQILEKLDAKNLSAAKHPYTKGLIGCAPDIDKKTEILPTLVRDDCWLDEIGNHQ